MCKDVFVSDGKFIYSGLLLVHYSGMEMGEWDGNWSLVWVEWDVKIEWLLCFHVLADSKPKSSGGGLFGSDDEEDDDMFFTPTKTVSKTTPTSNASASSATQSMTNDEKAALR